MIYPTKQYFPFPKHQNIGLLLFGRNQGDTDWRLSSLSSHRDTKGVGYDLGIKIEDIALSHNEMRGMSNIFAPKINFSGEISFAHELAEQIMLPSTNTVSLFRHRANLGSDGVEVPQNSAGLITGADCPMVFFYLPPNKNNDGRLLATHCARWAIINQERVMGVSNPKRIHEGVVENAINMLGGVENATKILVHITLSVKAEFFTHSVNHIKCGEQNKKLIQYISKQWGEQCFVGDNINEGCLNVPAVIMAQCQKFGIKNNNISCNWEDTYSTLAHGSIREPQWWSYIRESRKIGALHRKKRNLAWIIHG